ncbi:MAG: CoA transferase [Haloarculaceae archaeon]
MPTPPTRTTNTFDGLTVLDASRVLVEPFCTMQLGDLGADVLMLERPGGGDQTRRWHPPTCEDQSACYLSLDRNKRSLTLALAAEEGQEVFRDLPSEVDVLVENFRVG